MFYQLSAVMFKVITRSTRMMSALKPTFPMPSCANMSTGSSVWGVLEMAPPDKILALTQMFKDDKHPMKINLGAGTYRDNNNQPLVLECVKKADELVKSMDHEYAPIDGLQPFIKSSMELVYGKENSLLSKHGKHFASAQVLSGTGGLRVVFEMLALVASKREAAGLPSAAGSRDVYLPSPTWPNHPQIAMRAHLTPKTYRYYDAKRSVLDIDGLLEDFGSMPAGSNVLLHVCAHNPTGNYLINLLTY